MILEGASAIVTGGASGLGRASATRLAGQGAAVVIVDLPASQGAAVAQELAETTGSKVVFAAADVTDEDAVQQAVEEAAALAPLRVLVHCAGRGATVRVVSKDGSPGSQETFDQIVALNLGGTFNVLRLCAARMVTNEPIDGERGVCIMTSSVAAWEGQIGQLPYAASKAGIVGMTIVAARDLARSLVRVNAIAPGIFDTPILSRLSDDVIASLGAQVPHPARLGNPDEFGKLVLSIVDNAYINGETIRLDGAVRMGAR